MNDIVKNLDKSYAAYVLEKTGYTPYMLAKRTSMAPQTISRAVSGEKSLTWNTIYKIEHETGIQFRSQDHIIFATKFHEQNKQ